MKLAKTDPRASFPIVCSGYMRATGFFFGTDKQLYIITARHNLLPTNGKELATGDYEFNYRTEDILPIIDLYLKDGSRFTSKRINLFKKSGVLLDDTIDVIGIPTDIDPEEFGYTTWTLNDLIDSDSSQITIDSIGFPGRAFPTKGKYDTGVYSEELRGPYVLTLLNDFQKHPMTPSGSGLIDIGIDVTGEGESSDYNGYSGSPVLGDGLAGIHCGILPSTSINTNSNEKTKSMAIAYWKADVLKQLISTHIPIR